MNSFERYRCMVRGEPVDFVPRVPILMQYAAEYIGSNYGAFAADCRVLVKANQQCARDFGIDQLSVISDPYREVHGFGGEVEFVTDGVPRCLHPPLEHTTDLSTLARPNAAQGRMLDRVEAVRTYARENAGEYSILGWVEGPAAEAADLRTPVNFLMDLMDDEAFAADLMDLCIAVAIDFARAQVEAGADTIGIGDAIASQVSPGLYERLIQPREKQLVAAIHSMGALVKLHICGNITHLLPGIADLGCDIVDIDHLVDMKVARSTLGREVVLTGNLNPADEVRFGAPHAIRAALQQIYEQAGNPYMVNAGCEIPAGTPAANLRALCEPLPAL